MDKPEFLAWVGARAGRYELEGHGAVIEIAALGIDLPLSEIYAGLERS
jgi:hypothetical protein